MIKQTIVIAIASFGYLSIMSIILIKMVNSVAGQVTTLKLIDLIFQKALVPLQSELACVPPSTSNAKHEQMVLSTQNIMAYILHVK